MKFRYTLPQDWVDKVSQMEEFSNGAAQVSVKTKTGVVVPYVLISNSKYIIATRGYEDLPFSMNEIVEIFQTAEDKKPIQRGNWHFWDSWK